MTSMQRTLVVLTILVVTGALAVSSIIADHGSVTASVASFTGIAGTVLGYAFGDRNGEKRLAAAIVQTAADAGNGDHPELSQAHAVAQPGHIE